MTETRPWLTATEAAAYVRENLDTIRAAARAGTLRGYQRADGGPWRFHVDDLDAYVRGAIRPVATPADRRRRAV